MPDALMGPLFYNLDLTPCKVVGDIFGFAAQQTGEDKPFLGKKTFNVNQPAHDIVMDVGTLQGPPDRQSNLPPGPGQLRRDFADD